MKFLLFLLVKKCLFLGLLASPVSQVYDEYYDEEYDEYGSPPSGGSPPPEYDQYNADYEDFDADKMCILPPELDNVGEESLLIAPTTIL